MQGKLPSCICVLLNFEKNEFDRGYYYPEIFPNLYVLACQPVSSTERAHVQERDLLTAFALTSNTTWRIKPTGMGYVTCHSVSASYPKIFVAEEHIAGGRAVR